MYRCPKCGGGEFVVSAHVVQEWIVDKNGSFVEVINDCTDVTHKPDNEDVWACRKCGYDGPGSIFYKE